MENIQTNTSQPASYTYRIHRVLAHSYFMHFILLLVGVALDLYFRLKIFSSSVFMPVGFIFLVLASLLIIWAQRTSRNLKKGESVTKETFCRGPYCYTRSPTHWGLFLLMIGFGIIANATFVVISTVISFFLGRFIFLRQEEEALAQKYGTPYLEYKRTVKL